MSTLTLVLLALGLILLFAAPWITRMVIQDRDSVALTRIIQAVALVILVMALLLWPREPESTAFPPPPEGPPGASTQ